MTSETKKDSFDTPEERFVHAVIGNIKALRNRVDRAISDLGAKLDPSLKPTAIDDQENPETPQV